MKKILFIVFVLVIMIMSISCAKQEEHDWQKEYEEMLENFNTATTTVADSVVTTTPIAEPVVTTIPTVTTTQKPAETLEPSTDISPEFKAAMDSYEKFFDEYIEFMEKYKTATNPLAMMPDYLEYMEAYTETMRKLNEVNEEELTTEEAFYYAEVMLRINKKLANTIE